MSSVVDSQPVTGTSYLRSYRIELFNPLGGVPSTLFHQERLFTLDDGTPVAQPATDLRIDFDPSEEVHILDPATGADTGVVMTQAQIFAGIFSVYVAAATPPAGAP